MDLISDLLVKIKNAQAAGHETAETFFSGAKLNLLKILEREGFIGSLERKGAKNKEKIEINLKYDQGQPVISGLKRVSRPGQRVYIAAGDIKPVKQGYGIMIISTSKGLMSGQEARKNKLGGEILCEIW